MQSYETEVSAASLRLLHGTPEIELSQGVLQLAVPPRSLVVLSENGGRGFLKDGILYSTPMEGGVVQCESDAVAARYKIYNGIPELTGMYINGDILVDGDGEFRFFRWDKMQPK